MFDLSELQEHCSFLSTLMAWKQFECMVGLSESMFRMDAHGPALLSPERHFNTRNNMDTMKFEKSTGMHVHETCLV